MEESLTILRKGMSDKINILDELEMDAVLGGYVECKKKYTEYDDGTVSCGCGYEYEEDPPLEP